MKKLTNAEETHTVLSVWLDTVSDPGERVWIVSRDQIDSTGAAETTHTLSTHSTRAKAVKAAKRIGARLGLSVKVEEDNPRKRKATKKSRKRKNPISALTKI